MRAEEMRSILWECAHFEEQLVGAGCVLKMARRLNSSTMAIDTLIPFYYSETIRNISARPCRIPSSGGYGWSMGRKCSARWKYWGLKPCQQSNDSAPN